MERRYGRQEGAQGRGRGRGRAGPTQVLLIRPAPRSFISRRGAESRAARCKNSAHVCVRVPRRTDPPARPPVPKGHAGPHGFLSGKSRWGGAGPGAAAVPAASANGPRAVSPPHRPPPPPGLASRAGRRSHARGRGPRGAVWGARGGAGSFLVTQAFGLKGAAALRGRPPGPRSCACRLPVASNIRPDRSLRRGREPGRPQHFLLPQPSRRT